MWQIRNIWRNSGNPPHVKAITQLTKDPVSESLPEVSSACSIRIWKEEFVMKRHAIALALLSAPIMGTAFAGEWSGAYVGVTAGGAVGNQSQAGGVFVLPAPPPPQLSLSDGSYGLSGGLVGGSIGYGLQEGRYVFGLEGDGSWAKISGSATCGFWSSAPHACGGGVGAFGTVRGRVGYDLGPVAGLFGGVLAYVTGGLAVGEVRAWDSLFGTSGGATEAGWTVGGGLALKIAPLWSVKVEYLHVDLGNHAIFTAATFPEHVSTSAEIARVGAHYHLDFGTTAPVVANY
jgi:outer membrane immunogenic protein